MGKLKTLFIGLTLALTCFSQPALSMSDPSNDPVRFFAGCLGRLSATMEHEWLMGRDGEAARMSRRSLASLLDATAMDSGLNGAQILNLRIEAKFAQAKLLQTAAFAEDARLKRYAQQRAVREINACTSLLLG